MHANETGKKLVGLSFVCMLPEIDSIPNIQDQHCEGIYSMLKAKFLVHTNQKGASFVGCESIEVQSSAH